jgi:hypothetical protein
MPSGASGPQHTAGSLQSELHYDVNTGHGMDGMNGNPANGNGSHSGMINGMSMAQNGCYTNSGVNDMNASGIPFDIQAENANFAENSNLNFGGQENSNFAGHPQGMNNMNAEMNLNVNGSSNMNPNTNPNSGTEYFAVQNHNMDPNFAGQNSMQSNTPFDDDDIDGAPISGEPDPSNDQIQAQQAAQQVQQASTVPIVSTVTQAAQAAPVSTAVPTTSMQSSMPPSSIQESTMPTAGASYETATIATTFETASASAPASSTAFDVAATSASATGSPSLSWEAPAAVISAAGKKLEKNAKTTRKESGEDEAVRRELFLITA